jgi:hypothetical protein
MISIYFIKISFDYKIDFKKINKLQCCSLSNLLLSKTIKSIICKCRIFSNSIQLNSLLLRLRLPKATNLDSPSRLLIF